MELREKVIKKLEKVMMLSEAANECKVTLGYGVVEDILALLKAQEARLVTEADFENADGYGFLPVWVEEKDDSEIICDCITRHAITDPDENYHYRYWTSRPTTEQIDNTPWEERDNGKEAQ